MGNIRLVKLLIGLLLLSNLVLLILLYKKEPAAPPIIVAFEGKKAAYAKKFNNGNEDFWNNYPYVVVTNEGKLIDTTAYFNGRNKGRLDSLKGKLIYRYIQSKGYSATNDSTLRVLQMFPQVVIITDSISISYLNKKLNILHLENDVYILNKRRISNRTDNIGHSYLFYINRYGNITNLYYPRSQTPETTEKYLAHVSKSLVFY